MARERGKFIVFEGLDRAGKTTQVDSLVRNLRELSLSVETLKFPDRTTAIGKMINTYLTTADATLSDESIHLLFSANRWELAEKINSLLNQGYWLVVDRYTYSGAAFSSAKGLDLDWCMAPDKGLPEPDLVVFLDVSKEVAEKRGGFGEERYEKSEFQQKVRAQFLRMKSENWRWISADDSIENVEAAIWSVTTKEFNLKSSH